MIDQSLHTAESNKSKRLNPPHVDYAEGLAFPSAEMAPKRARKRRKDQGGESTGKIEAREIEHLNERIAAEAPAPGTRTAPASARGMGSATSFDELPISSASASALRSAGFEQLTAVQRTCIPHALCGRDVLGSAKTGSGKTLAFLVPALERLFRKQWTSLDGLGVLVLAPTRELALQVFSNVRIVGKHHPYSGAVLIGGKEVATEKNRVAGVNVLVCTPGRLLQHMDETPHFECVSLQCLVIDEADRTLDMGFKPTLDAILSNLPPSWSGRQTMLFSATQGQSVGSLAKLSLSAPEYISVHAEAETSTPASLMQLYTEVKLEDKLEVLWSFIKSHLACKTLVFFSTCRQAQFVHEAFRQLRPGVTIRTIHGRVKQKRRLAVYDEFCKAKHMVLFATDIASRGLDFPAVDWVLQADCPETPDVYIHRVGRTARFKSTGKALTLLLPSELRMVSKLEEARVPIKRMEMNRRKRQPISSALKTLLSKDSQLKHFAQKAVSSYLRGVHLAGDREVFDTTSLPVAEFAVSLGLQNPPRLRFLSESNNSKRERLAQTKSSELRDDDAKEGYIREQQAAIHHDATDDDVNQEREGLHKEEEEVQFGLTGAGRSGDDPKANALRSSAKRRTLDIGDEESEDEHEESRDARAHLGTPSGDDHCKVPGNDDADGADERLLKQRLQNEQVLQQVRGQKPAKPPRRLKIKEGGVANRTGSKLVFTDSGEALPPLAKMSSGMALSGDANEYMNEAKMRFQRLAEERANVDAEDRKRERERVRKKHERIKEKKKSEDDIWKGQKQEPEAPVLDDDGGNISSGGSENEDEEHEAEERTRAAKQHRTAASKRELAHKGTQVTDASAAPGGLSELERAALSKLRK